MSDRAATQLLPIVAFGAAFGCTPPTGPRIAAGPEIAVVNPDCPLSRLIRVTFDREVSLRGDATDGVHVRPIDLPPAQEQEIELVGLYTDRTWTVDIEATDADGASFRLDPITFTTPPLPASFPHVDVRTADPAAMEPGLTLVPVTSPQDIGYLAVFDADGELAWIYLGNGHRFLETRFLANGHLATFHDTELLEIDWMGRIYRDLTANNNGAQVTPLGVHALNHELSIDGEGHWLTLTQESRDVVSFPLSYDFAQVRGQASVVSDELIVVDPDSGEILDRVAWPDFADLGRIGYDSLNETDPGLDWTHANAAVEFPSGDSWLLSSRHQDAVVRLDKTTRQIRWILGNPDNWGPEFAPFLLEPQGAPFSWQYHQHAAKISADERHVLLFDNGNHHAEPWTFEPELEASAVESRVVEYEVDEAARTVRQDWEFVLDPPVYSTAMGDADWLPNGDVLATYAYVFWEGHVPNGDLGRGAPSFRVVEFVPSTGRVVWDLDVWAPVGDPRPNWQSYRAERFPGFDAL